MIQKDVAYIEAPARFTDQQIYQWNKLGSKDYFMQSLLYCTKIKKYPMYHTKKILYIKHNDTYYTHKKRAEIVRNQYFLK